MEIDMILENITFISLHVNNIFLWNVVSYSCLAGSKVS